VEVEDELANTPSTTEGPVLDMACEVSACGARLGPIWPSQGGTEEEKKKQEEEKEGQVHQGEIEKSFYGCDVETPPTSSGSGGSSTGTTTVSAIRILTAPVVMPAL